MAVRKRAAVGVVGLGIRGGAFAQNLLAAGWRVMRVIGYDIAPQRRCAFARIGAEIAADAGDLACRAPTKIVHRAAEVGEQRAQPPDLGGTARGIDHDVLDHGLHAGATGRAVEQDMAGLPQRHLGAGLVVKRSRKLSFNSNREAPECALYN